MSLARSLNRLATSLRGVRHISSPSASATATTPFAPPPIPSTTASPTASPSSPLPSTSARKATTPAPSSSAPHRSSANQYLPVGALEKHTPIPPKHGVHVATLHLRAHTSSLADLTFFTSFALRAARALALPTSGAIALPTRTSLFTVPRSPFAHKKSQENFWRKEHKRAIKVYDGNEEIVQAWLAYLRKEAMGGVGMKAQVMVYRELGWGKKMVSTEALRQTGLVESLAKELVEELSTGVEATEQVESAKAELEGAKGEQRVLEVTSQVAEEKVEQK